MLQELENRIEELGRTISAFDKQRRSLSEEGLKYLEYGNYELALSAYKAANTYDELIAIRVKELNELEAEYEKLSRQERKKILNSIYGVHGIAIKFEI